MPTYAELGKEELTTLKTALTEEYETYKAQGLSLNMARGKPGSDQLDLSMPMLDILPSSDDCKAENGTDIRNYGVVDGLPEAKKLMASMLDDEDVYKRQVYFHLSRQRVERSVHSQCIRKCGRNYFWR